MCGISLTPHISNTSGTFFYIIPTFQTLAKLTHQWVSDKQTESRHPESCILDTSSRRINSLYGMTRKKRSLHVWHSRILLQNIILSGAEIRRWKAYGYEGQVLCRPTLSPLLPLLLSSTLFTHEMERVHIWFSFASSQCPTQQLKKYLLNERKEKFMRDFSRLLVFFISPKIRLRRKIHAKSICKESQKGNLLYDRPWWWVPSEETRLLPLFLGLRQIHNSPAILVTWTLWAVLETAGPRG